MGVTASAKKFLCVGEAGEDDVFAIPDETLLTAIGRSEREKK